MGKVAIWRSHVLELDSIAALVPTVGSLLEVHWLARLLQSSVDETPDVDCCVPSLCCYLFSVDRKSMVE
jgi:hypothetical protein